MWKGLLLFSLFIVKEYGQKKYPAFLFHQKFIQMSINIKMCNIPKFSFWPHGKIKKTIMNFLRKLFGTISFFLKMFYKTQIHTYVIWTYDLVK